MIGDLCINRLQSLDARSKGSSAGFFQVGAGFHWLLNASLQCLLGLFFFLRNLDFIRKLECAALICLISACGFVPEPPLEVNF